jgi:hypothetical protein
MQYIIGKIAWFMQQCLHTTAAEVEKNIPKKKEFCRKYLVDDRSGKYICWNERSTIDDHAFNTANDDIRTSCCTHWWFCNDVRF